MPLIGLGNFSLDTKSKWVLVGTLGIGVALGASAVVVLQKLSKRGSDPHNSVVSWELASIHVSIKDLQDAIAQLKESRTHNTSQPYKSALRTVTFAEVEQSMRDKNPLVSSSSASSLCEFYSAISSSSVSSQDYCSMQSISDVEKDSDEDEEKEGVSYEDKGVDKEEASSDDDAREEEEPDESEVPFEAGDPRLLKFTSERDETIEIFRVVDEHFLNNHDPGALDSAIEYLKTCEEKVGENGEYLWRLCKALCLKASTFENNELKKKLIFEAVPIGERAIECSNNSSEAHKWYAIAVGSRSEFMGIKDKIVDAFDFKRHIDRAAELSPHDHTIHHLLGRFCFEVASLTWLERKMASAMFAEPPTATMEEAREHFVEAEKIKQDGWKENSLFIAKTFVATQDYENAFEWLDAALLLPINNTDDESAHKEIVECLERLQRYRKDA